MTAAITCRAPSPSEFMAVSAQLAESYRAAYAGMMKEHYLSSLRNDHWVEILRQGADRGDVCLVAECGAELTGTAVFGPGDQPGCAVLHAIYLLPRYIGRGLGHVLYEYTQNAMVRCGYVNCQLEVLTENGRAIQFYISHGFEKTASFTVFENGRNLHCDAMSKHLPKAYL